MLILTRNPGIIFHSKISFAVRAELNDMPARETPRRIITRRTSRCNDVKSIPQEVCVFERGKCKTYTRMYTRVSERSPDNGMHSCANVYSEMFVRAFTERNLKHFPYYVYYQHYNLLAAHSHPSHDFSAAYTPRKLLLLDLRVHN